MPVYIDDMFTISLGRFGRMKMSHMAADTTTELVEMASRIGVNPKWIQRPGEGAEHFDISKSKRALALKNGAIPVSMRVLCPALVTRRGPNEKLTIEIPEVPAEVV